MRLLRGEELETVSRELGVTAATLSGWRDQFLKGGAADLKAREADIRDRRDVAAEIAGGRSEHER